MLSEILEEKFERYNRESFIEDDPVCIPHLFSRKENIEISGLLAATLAWGQRKTIIRNARQLMALMENNPVEFLQQAREKDLHIFHQFVHRTFNGTDTQYFIRSLAHIYRNHGGIEAVFTAAFQQQGSLEDSLRRFRRVFFELPHEQRTEKHMADIDRGAAAKRLNMFLRWMVRKDGRGVDFGIWKDIPASALYIPLDVHSGKVARELGLLKRKQNDWKAVLELTDNLRKYDPADPVKYDFALFGMGVFEK